jgi:hypothetical protein
MSSHKILRYLVFFGDIIYILWILYNGIDEGFRNIASVRAFALIGLIILLTLNIFLLTSRR